MIEMNNEGSVHFVTEYLCKTSINHDIFQFWFVNHKTHCKTFHAVLQNLICGLHW